MLQNKLSQSRIKTDCGHCDNTNCEKFAIGGATCWFYWRPNLVSPKSENTATCEEFLEALIVLISNFVFSVLQTSFAQCGLSRLDLTMMTRHKIGRDLHSQLGTKISKNRHFLLILWIKEHRKANSDAQLLTSFYFKMILEKMVPICPDFKCLGLWILDPIWNLDHLQPNLF